MTAFGASLFNFMANAFYLLVGIICAIMSCVLLYGLYLLVAQAVKDIRRAIEKRGREDG